MARAIPCPCSGPKTRILRINRSRVPCINGIRPSSSSRVDIRPEYELVQVECQPESGKGRRKGSSRRPPEDAIGEYHASPEASKGKMYLVSKEGRVTS